MEMKISIHAVDGHAVVIVSYEDGETPHAYTVAEMCDWLSEPLESPSGTDHFNQAAIIAAVLERFEMDLIDPVK